MEIKESLTILEESMYSVAPKKRSTSSSQSQASNDVYVDLSEEHSNMIAITMKGRTSLVPADRAQRIAEKIMSLAGNIIQEEELEEKTVSKKNNYGIAPAEKHTKHDPPGTKYKKGTSARSGMVG